MPTRRQLPSRTRTSTAVRGRAVQKKIGRTKGQRSTRPPNRDRPARDRPMRRTQEGRQSSDRAGSGQGSRKD